MALTIKTAATSKKLAAVIDIADELGCTVDDYPVLDRMLQQASDAIVRYCGRYFAKQTYVETLPGFGGPTLQLAVWPVASVVSVKDKNATPITDFVLQEPESGLLWREAGWEWTTLWSGRLNPQPWPQSEEYAFTVEYVAGYDLPETLVPTLPGDVERAAIITVKDWYANKTRNQSIKKVSVGGVSMDYGGADTFAGYLGEDLPPTAMRLLSRWRVVE
jgi:hypothetical protein